MSVSSQRLATRILWAMVIGAVAGSFVLLVGHWQTYVLDVSRVIATQVLEPVGKVFLHLLFFVVVPLIFASLALGIVQLGRLDQLGSMAARTALLFAANMAIGVGLGLLLMNLLRPGDAIDEATKANLRAQFETRAAEAVHAREAQPPMNLSTVVNMFFPRNLAKAIVDFEML